MVSIPHIKNFFIIYLNNLQFFYESMCYTEFRNYGRTITILSSFIILILTRENLPVRQVFLVASVCKKGASDAFFVLRQYAKGCCFYRYFFITPQKSKVAK